MAALFVPALSYADVEPSYVEAYYDEETFYSDENRVVELTAYDEDDNVIAGWTGKIEAGFWDWDSDSFITISDDCFTYSGSKVTFYGSKVAEALKTACPGEESGLLVLRQAGDEGWLANLSFWPAREEYDWPFDNRYLLVGSSYYMDGYVTCYIENSHYREGEDFDCPITKVTASPSGIVRIAKDGSDWEIEGLKQGDATLTLTYKDPNGKAATHKIDIHVVYSYMDIEMTMEGDEELVPGQSVQIRAQGEVIGDFDEDEQQIQYNWGVEGIDEQYVNISVDPGDPSTATVALESNVPDNLINTGFDVWVEATGKDGDGKEVSGRACLSEDYDKLWIREEIVRIVPQTLALFPGESKEVTPQLMHYTRENPEGRPDEDVYFEFRIGDEGTDEDLRIEEKAGHEGTFILTRNTWAYVDLDCIAYFEDDEGEEVEVESKYYYLNELSSDLENYLLECPDLEETELYIDDLNGEEGQMDLPQVRLTYEDSYDNTRTVPEDFYTLKFQRVIGWDAATGEEILKDIEPGTKIGLDPTEEGYDGTAEYRITAVPAEGSLFEDSETCTYLSFYSKWSMAVVYADFYEWQYFVSTGDAGGYFRVPAGKKIATEAYTAEDKTLTQGEHYSLSYSNKKTGASQAAFPTKIGDYEIVLRGIAPYYGERISEYTLQIVPKGTSIVKLKKGKKSFTVKWKKQKSQTRGYEIQYSLKKNFKGKKTVKIKKNKITSKKIGKLKKKKTYYVRVRTFGKANGKTYYSAWSKVKKVKTK